MRASSPVLACALAALAACQDSAASNSERDTHMGDIHAVPPPSLVADAAPAAAQPAPAAAPPPAGGAPDH
jgi:hypothetical protein